MSNPEAKALEMPANGVNRRLYERVPVSIFGRCMFENKLEITCQAINISPGDMAAIAANLPIVGEHLIIYLDNIGRVEGDVVRLFEGGFAMLLDGTERMREKLEAKILWYQNNAQFGQPDLREHNRVTPRQTLSDITLTDGRSYPIEIIDISLSGAAVRSEVRPSLGTVVKLGGMQGTVVRHFDEGLAIEFATALDLQKMRAKFV